MMGSSAEKDEDLSPSSIIESDDLGGDDDEEKSFSGNRVKPHTLREAYGFVIYLSTILLAIFWTLWIVLPDEYIDRLGITYRPQKYERKLFHLQKVE